MSSAVELKLSQIREQERARILGKGLSQLPDELFSMILETGYRSFCEEPNASDFSITVSHVSRRFRTISLNTPILWSTLSNSQTIAEINAFIPRSKAVGLTIVINEDWELRRHNWLSRPIIEEFINVVIPLAPRWVEFRSNREYTYDRELPDLWAIASHTREFPRLKRLMVNAGAVTTDVDPNENPRPESDYFSTWNMPQLMFFYGDNIILSRLTPISCNLSTCHLNLEANEPYDWDFAALLRTLEGFPRLNVLILSFERVGSQDVPLGLPSTTLGSLQELNIVVSCSSRMAVVRSLIHSFRLPHLDTLSYRLMFKKANIVSFLRSIFPPSRNCPQLKSVTITGEAKHAERSAFETIFQSFPHIHCLRVAVPTFASNYTYSNDPPIVPPLRILILEDCNLLSAQAFERIMDALYESSTWEELKKVEVVSCLYLSAAILPSQVRPFLGDKIIFRTRTKHRL